MSRLPVDTTTRLPRLPAARAWLAPRSGGHRLHAGIDLPAGPRDGVFAPEAGELVLVASSSRPTEPRRSTPDGWSGYGPGVVVLRGDSGWWHVLSHVAPLDPPGELATPRRVSEGELVAHGSAVGHVHWEVRAQRQPTGGAATVELTADPASWLAGSPRLWSGQCPEHPVDDRRTPRACRPSWEGPPPDPFRHPAPRRPRGQAATPHASRETSRGAACADELGEREGSDG